jgi:endogenous inhibitor of DNA gyrase (YacG/DUF329 family)
MFCPNCGQQQVSEEMRFCSRCGLALSGLAEWLGGGLLVRRTEETPTPSRRRKAIRRAAKLMFLSAVIFPIFLAISIGVDDPGPLFLPFFLFFISGVWMLYARLFMDDTAALNQAPQTAAVGPMPTARVSLPPSNLPVTDIGRQQVRTNELIQVPSVTEHTTKLLDNE